MNPKSMAAGWTCPQCSWTLAYVLAHKLPQIELQCTRCGHPFAVELAYPKVM